MTLEDYTTEQLIEEIERRSLEKIWSESGIISYDFEPGNELMILKNGKWNGAYFSNDTLYKLFVFIEPLQLKSYKHND